MTACSPRVICDGSHGVMVSTLDSESSDPSSNLGGTSAAQYCTNFVFDVSPFTLLITFLRGYELLLFYCLLFKF